MEKGKCECEHAAHFDRDFRTPNGNPGHRYGQEFSTRYLQEVRTAYGKFTVCKDCAEDCTEALKGGLTNGELYEKILVDVS